MSKLTGGGGSKDNRLDCNEFVGRFETNRKARPCFSPDFWPRPTVECFTWTRSTCLTMASPTYCCPSYQMGAMWSRGRAYPFLTRKHRKELPVLSAVSSASVHCSVLSRQHCVMPRLLKPKFYLEQHMTVYPSKSFLQASRAYLR
jgi:hypothetical protein